MIKVVQTIILVLFIILGKTDEKEKEIPMAGIVLFGIVCLCGGVAHLTAESMSVYEIMTGCAIGFIMLLCGILTKEQIGTGDGMLVTFLGIFCGRKVLVIVWLAALAGCGKAFFLLFTKKGTKKTKFAFVPALGVGYVVSLFL